MSNQSTGTRLQLGNVMEAKSNLLSPLYVDLDGTFIKSDTLFESLLVVSKRNPFIIFMCFIWIFKGKSFMKAKLAQLADIAMELMPLNTEFYDFLLDEKAKNRQIILATASNEKYAQNVCRNYDIFDSYMSSDASTNLKGAQKLYKIQEQSTRFAYAGNSSEDFVIFAQAEESYLVNPTKKARKLSLKSKVSRVFDDERKSIKVWLKQLRVHQWLKNLLLFVPLLVTKGFTHIDTIMLSVLGFISFSCLASATYIINDLLDLQSDRSHQRKKFRPIAAGLISIVQAKAMALVLFAISLAIALSIEGAFVLVLATYLALTLFYSFKVKQYIILDVLTLAMLYTIRIIAGAAILNVPVSFWLLSFSMFIFSSLALVKRCSELKSLANENKTQAKGREYETADFNVLMNFGTSLSMLAVLMFSFYINNNILTNQFQAPTILWLIIPALCYWLMRMWVKTSRGEMHDDPIIFSIKDKGSLMTVSFIVVITMLAQVL